MREQSEKLIDIGIQAQWMASPDNDYASYGNEFRRALSQITEGADNANVDQATLGYVQAIFACVYCHDVVRDNQRIANLDSDALRGTLLPQLLSQGAED